MTTWNFHGFLPSCSLPRRPDLALPPAAISSVSVPARLLPSGSVCLQSHLEVRPQGVLCPSEPHPGPLGPPHCRDGRARMLLYGRVSPPRGPPPACPTPAPRLLRQALQHTEGCAHLFKWVLGFFG